VLSSVICADFFYRYFLAFTNKCYVKLVRKTHEQVMKGKLWRKELVVAYGGNIPGIFEETGETQKTC
jgi:hypothetical protein